MRHLLLYIMLLFCTYSFSAEYTKTIIDYETTRSSCFGTDPHTNTDVVNGGLSTVSSNTLQTSYQMPQTSGGANGTNMFLKLDYALDKGTSEYEPYIQYVIPTRYNKDSATDLSQWDGITYWYKGPAHECRINLTTVSDYDDFFIAFPASEHWKKAVVPFNSLKQHGWGKTIDWDPTIISAITINVQSKENVEDTISLDEFELYTATEPFLPWETNFVGENVTGLANLTSAKYQNDWSDSEASYQISFNADTMSVAFTRAEASVWGGIFLPFISEPDSFDAFKTSATDTQDNLSGTTVDITGKQLVSFKVKVDKALTLRVDLHDKNDRNSNSESNKLLILPSDDWQEVSFAWNPFLSASTFVYEMDDAYGASRFGVRYAHDGIIPEVLDQTNIAKVQLLIDDGKDGIDGTEKNIQITDLRIGSEAVEKSWGVGTDVTSLLPVPIYIGDDSDFSEYNTVFSLNKETIQSAYIDVYFHGNMGPNYEDAPKVILNGTEFSVAEYMPVADESLTWWSTNQDNSHDLQTPFNATIQLSTDDLVLTGTNTLTIEDGRVDDDFGIGKINLVIQENIITLTGLSLPANDTIYLDGAKVLFLTKTPIDAYLPNLQWTSSAETICTVSASGEITGITEGDAIITVTNTEDETISAVCSVHVRTPNPLETQVILDFEHGITSSFGTDLESFVNQGTDSSSITPNPKTINGTNDLQYNTERDSYYGEFQIELKEAGLEWGGFAELQLSTGEWSVPRDLSKWHGVSFWHKGDALSFYILLQENINIKGFNPFQVQVPASNDWQLYTYRWDDFKQWEGEGQVEWDAAKICMFAFRNNSMKDESLSYSIDDIALFASETIFASKISLDPDFFLKSGNTKTLTPEVIPSDASLAELQWTSSNESVATVSTDGTVTGKSSGTATISYSSSAFPFASASTSVSVYNTGEVVTISDKVLDFEENTYSSWGHWAYTMSDKQINDGGESTIDPFNSQQGLELTRHNEGANGTSQSMKLEYSLVKGTSEYDAWVNFGLPANNANGSPRDLSAYDGFEFWQKGDAVTFEVETDNVKDWALFRVEVPASDEWVKRTVYWDHLAQPFWGMSVEWDASVVNEIKYSVYSNTDVTGTVYIDEIALIQSTYVPLTGIELPASQSVAMGSNLTLSPTLYPNNASTPTLQWTSSNRSVATVTSAGVITPVSAGTAFITATTEDGFSTSTMVTVSSATVNPTAISLLPTTLKVGATLMLEPMIMPTDANFQGITWATSDESTVTVSSKGVISALKAGTATITASINGTTLTSSAVITVQAISQLKVASIPAVNLNTESPAVNVNLAPYILSADGAVSWQLLQFNVANVSLTMDQLGISYAQVSSAEPGYCVLKVTDQSSSSAIIRVDYTFDAAVVHETDTISLLLNERSVSIALSLNDLLPSFEIGSEGNVSIVKSSENISISLAKGVALISNNGMAGAGETITLTYGADEVVLAISPSAQTNTAPVVSAIPEQVAVEGYFVDLNLNAYVTDDYTMPSGIKWTMSPAKKISIDIFSNRVSAQALSPTWIGTEQIWFYAADASGLKDSALVTYTKATASDLSAGDPVYVDFTANKLIVTPGTPIQFQPNMANVTYWLWEFPGANIEESEALNETVQYASIGKKSVMLSGQSSELTIGKTVKHDYIEVVGITTRDTSILLGSEVTLSVSGSVTNYTWNTGEVNTSITVNPTETTDYIIRIQDGLIKLYDTITISVVEPADLGADRSICAGSEATLYPGNFSVYEWSDASTEPTLTVSAPGTYTVTVQTGTYTQIESVKISTYPETTFDAGDDIAVCPGTNATVTLPPAFSYNWSDGSNANVNDQLTAGKYFITATDINGCVALDSVTITNKEAFVEPLGIVTVNEASNNMIVAWERTDGKETVSYNVYKSGLFGFDKIGSVAFSDPGLFTDKNSDVRETQFTYAITTVNACGEESDRSVAHTSVHVQKVVDVDGNYSLSWNTYIGKELQGYKIFGGPTAASVSVLKELPKENTSYTVLDTQKEYVYRVVAVFADEVDPTRLKSDSGPFSQSLSNLSEAVVVNDAQMINGVVDIYPNPFTDGITIKVAGEFSYSISSVDGLIVRYGESSGSVLVDMNNLPVGVYSIQVETVSTNISERILKQ